MRRLFLLVLLSSWIALSASGATIIDFDTNAAGVAFTAPTTFAATSRLTTLYSSLGVVFQGPAGNNGGAIVNHSGFFGVLALSGPNFLAFNRIAVMNDGGVPTDPETIIFATPVTAVSIQAAGGFNVDSFTMRAFDSSDALVGTANYTGQLFGLLSISAPGITKVLLTQTGDNLFVYDNLVFETAPIPEPSTGLLVVAGLVGVVGWRRVRA